MSFANQTGTNTTTTAQPFYFPGQEEYIPKFVAPLQSMYEGNMTSGTAKTMQGLAMDAASKEAAAQRGQIAGTPGLSAPAKAKLVGEASDKAIKGAAGVPGSMWSTALQTLSQYSLQAPTVGQTSVSSGGGGSKAGLCWVWTHFNGEHGDDTEVMRAYRDRVYGKGSAVDIGYKMMGLFILPLMVKSPLLQEIVHLLIYAPLTALARGSRNPMLGVYAKGWELVWKVLGWAASHFLTRRTAMREE